MRPFWTIVGKFGQRGLCTTVTRGSDRDRIKHSTTAQCQIRRLEMDRREAGCKLIGNLDKLLTLNVGGRLAVLEDGALPLDVEETAA